MGERKWGEGWWNRKKRNEVTRGSYSGECFVTAKSQWPPFFFSFLQYRPSHQSLRGTLKEVICLFSPALFQPHMLSVGTSGELDTWESRALSAYLCHVVEACISEAYMFIMFSYTSENPGNEDFDYV